MEAGIERVCLRYAMLLSIRPIRPEDAPRLHALFKRLSPASVYLRFLGYRRGLSDAEARSLAGVDYHKRISRINPFSISGIHENSCPILLAGFRQSLVRQLPALSKKLRDKLVDVEWHGFHFQSFGETD